MKGAQRGPLAGIPATGAEVAIDAIVIHRLGDGLIAEDRVVRDSLTLLGQLGALPPPG